MMRGVGRLLPLAEGLATPDGVVLGAAVLLLDVSLSNRLIGSAVVLRVMFAALKNTCNLSFNIVRTFYFTKGFGEINAKTIQTTKTI